MSKFIIQQLTTDLKWVARMAVNVDGGIRQARRMGETLKRSYKGEKIPSQFGTCFSGDVRIVGPDGTYIHI